MTTRSPFVTFWLNVPCIALHLIVVYYLINIEENYNKIEYYKILQFKYEKA